LGEHGKQASKRDIRRTNRYFKSEEGLAKIEAARNAHMAEERKKEQQSYSDWADSKVQQGLANFKAKVDALRGDIATLDVAPTTNTKSVNLKPKWTATNADVADNTDTYTVKAGNTLGQIVSAYNKKK
jgi:LysM repeat protein